jgi:hypothetical protein
VDDLNVILIYVRLQPPCPLTSRSAQTVDVCVNVCQVDEILTLQEPLRKDDLYTLMEEKFGSIRSYDQETIKRRRRNNFTLISINFNLSL